MKGKRVEQVLHDLIVALRGSGVRISPAESMDAMRAATLLGCDDRRVFHDALSVVLAKSLHEKEIFKTCFDRFFSLHGFSDPDTQAPAPPLLTSDDLDSPLTRMLLSGDST